MTVKELKDLIANCKDEDVVSFQALDGCCGDYLELEVSYSDVLEGKDYRFPRIQFEQLPGFRSCIQSGGTKRADEEYWKDKPKRT